MAEITLTKDNFQAEVLDSDIPVLVDFWAVWCGPCQMVAPIVAEIAEEYEGKVKVGKVNTDEEPLLSMQYQVTAIPTLYVFKNGEVAGKIIGFASKEEIVQLF